MFLFRLSEDKDKAVLNIVKFFFELFLILFVSDWKTAQKFTHDSPHAHKKGPNKRAWSGPYGIG